jgi:peptide/nickel transport system permease protein
VGQYLLRRFVLTAATVVAVSFLAFLAFSPLDPSGPLVLDPTPHGHAALVFIREHYHLTDDPVSRWWRWAGGVVRHGFGNTVSTEVAAGYPLRLRNAGEPIGPQLLDATRVTAALVGAALVLVVVGSIAVGALGARRGGVALSSRFLAYLGAAIPTFLIGDLLKKGLVQNPHTVIGPSGGGLASSGWFLLGPPSGGPGGWARHLALPVLTLALGLIGVYSRYVRASLLVTLAEPYITVARAKGLSERRVLVRHALRLALVPVTALLSLEMGAVVGASLAADAVFNAGGLASVFISALGRADPFELTAIVTVSAVVVCVFSFAGEGLLGALDPRTARS